MVIFIPREARADETRVPVIPETVVRLVKRGADVLVESGAGLACAYTDHDYTGSGATIAALAEGLERADLVLRLNKPPIQDIHRLRRGTLHISYLDPFSSFELLGAFCAQGVDAIAMEMIPRTTIAQKMDALSSQASLAGYVAVIQAAERLNQILPMMMTPAGTLKPARVFIIGCGVAGLQAIATAKRLGARVEAFDTRPVVEEQVQSLGARFVKIDLGETGQTKNGYARELTDEQRQRQQDAMAKVLAHSDIVITTAQVFGKRAPRLVTEAMVKGMRPGSVVVDMAVETGGNVEGSRPGEDVLVNGVRIVGMTNLAGRVPIHASQMYSSNIGNLVEHFWDNETKRFRLDLSDEILKGCVIIHNGEIRNEMIKNARMAAHA
ncbi:MAG: Re/Si-specific NAD(P)(+) transhydrogenase subunit alpha [Candidatus Hydrogenedentes bacterium]|nr:Re/Si-specific NAD(P)(+) transhydrogenase subunit alpha [Candidatus Hydrogenedentota bacterium]